MYEPVPKHAERLMVDAVQKLVNRPSRFVPGFMALSEQFVCPKCKAEGEPLAEGTTRACRCGLRLQMRALQVYVWPELAVVA